MIKDLKSSTIPALIITAIFWLVFGLDNMDLVPKVGVTPRTSEGLIGILTMPIMHSNLQHILANTMPFLVLMSLFVFAHKGNNNSWLISFIIMWIGCGVMVWAGGRDANHVGMSGVIFGLWAYIITYGVLKRRFFELTAAIIVIAMYGGLFFSLLDFNQPGVSVEGHLYGAFAGFLLAKNNK